MVRQADRTDRRGVVLLWSVAAYGLATIIFGLSHVFWLTFLCLVALGASDMVSTVFRNIIRQLATPDHLRGRMTSVNMIFFMGGPQLGELEAGLLADRVGAPLSVVLGGIGAVLAVWWVGRTSPQLRNYRREDDLIAQRAAAPAD